MEQCLEERISGLTVWSQNTNEIRHEQNIACQPATPEARRCEQPNNMGPPNLRRIRSRALWPPQHRQHPGDLSIWYGHGGVLCCAYTGSWVTHRRVQGLRREILKTRTTSLQLLKLPANFQHLGETKPTAPHKEPSLSGKYTLRICPLSEVKVNQLHTDPCELLGHCEPDATRRGWGFDFMEWVLEDNLDFELSRKSCF